MEPINATGNDVNIHVDDVTICYDDFGKGLIPVIFIHGFPFDKSSWQPQMDFLKKSHRVIAYDIRGFGKSTAGKEKMSIELFADDLIKFMDYLQIPQAIVCGLSMGGYILLNAVNRYPGKFKAIILCDTQCIADTPEVKEKRSQTISHIMASGLKDFAEGFIKNIFCQETLDAKKEIAEKIKNTILSTSAVTVTGTLNALAQRWETCSSLHEISIPALILCGKEDKVTPLAQSEFLLQNIANATLHSISKAGHVSNLEQPDEFNQHIYSFISGL
ncbi:MAG TPA: alpha/beta fold hydrolase [Bacteroidia bacterium]|nr:alpha/beta fold hydrolase [Bacteroidia bacterium]